MDSPKYTPEVLYYQRWFCNALDLDSTRCMITQIDSLFHKNRHLALSEFTDDKIRCEYLKRGL